jgi:sec-independent protein translocase protein TatC
MNHKPDLYKMSFGDHLEELRSRIMKALVAPLILLFPALYFGDTILAWLIRPVYDALAASDMPQRLQVLGPTEAFVAYFKVAIIAALVCTGPIIVWQAWKFVSPGLYMREKRFAYLLIPMSMVLTIVGVLFLYYVVLPLSLAMLIKFGQGITLGSPPPGMVQQIDPDQSQTATDDGSAGGAQPGATGQDQQGDGQAGGDSGQDSDTSNADPGTSGDESRDGNAQAAGEEGEEAVEPEPEPEIDVSTLPYIPELKKIPDGLQPGQMFYYAPTKQLIVVRKNGDLLAADFRPIVSPFSQEFQLKTYINLVFILTLAFAIAFQLPLVILLLGWAGFVDVPQLRRVRKYALFAIVIFGAMLTPPDVISQISLAIPLYLLYEGSIILLQILPVSRVAGTESEREPMDDERY